MSDYYTPQPPPPPPPKRTKRKTRMESITNIIKNKG